MAFRKVSVVQVKELLRRWLGGEGERPVAKAVGVARTTARGYIAAAVELGVDRAGGVEQLTDELIGQVCERVRPHRLDGHGESWRALLAEEAQITAWVGEGLTVVKIGVLLGRRGVEVPHRTLARFAVERCGEGAAHNDGAGGRPAPGPGVPGATNWPYCAARSPSLSWPTPTGSSSPRRPGWSPSALVDFLRDPGAP